MTLHPFSTDIVNHAITAKTYATEAARDADTKWNLISTNINKVVKITDINVYQILKSIYPAVFQQITSNDSIATVGTGTLVIPLTSAFVSKATGGAEALSLADGTPGQELTISLTTDGGDGTLTPATATGWATAVFAAVGDTVSLKYIDDTVGWILVGAWGTAAGLTPVITL